MERQQMQRLRNPRIGIDQGDLVLFSEFDSGGSMWTGEGSRERRKQVSFREVYRQPPAVQVSISLWDMDTNAAIRAELVAENVSLTGFEMVFRTWGDSRVARLRAAWTAIGELPFEDDWHEVD
jgi:H-type lectin domain